MLGQITKGNTEIFLVKLSWAPRCVPSRQLAFWGREVPLGCKDPPPLSAMSRCGTALSPMVDDTNVPTFVIQQISSQVQGSTLQEPNILWQVLLSAGKHWARLSDISSWNIRDKPKRWCGLQLSPMYWSKMQTGSCCVTLSHQNSYSPFLFLQSLLTSMSL